MKILITGGNGNIAKIIKNNLSSDFDIINPSHTELDLLDFNKLKEFLNDNQFDVLIHTAISGGRRTKQETGDITHNNLLMFENIIFFAEKFKMILNFDSAAIYDRTTDILNRKEEDMKTIPNDYYGFSKYIIHKRSLAYSNFYNFRIFNIFHANEEPDRFIKSCFLAKKNNTILTIYEDKYCDFVYEDLERTINICYKEKYKLSDIAQKIIGNNNINIIKPVSHNNYSGNNFKLEMLNLNLIGLDQALILYENKCVL